MKKSEKEPELRENSLQRLNTTVTSIPAVHQNTCMHAYYHQHLRRGGPVDRGSSTRPDDVEQRVEAQHGGATAATDLHHRPFDICCVRPAESGRSSRRADRRSWGRGPDRYGATESEDAARDDEAHFQPESEEELELPLPLRSDDEWESPFLPPHHHTHTNRGLHRPVDMSYYPPAGGGQHSFTPDHRYQHQPCHHFAPCQHDQPWAESPHQCRRRGSVRGSVDEGSVSVNMPLVSVPAAEDVSEVSVMNLSSAGAETSALLFHERTRSVSLPDESRNIFVTYSSDASSEIVPFTHFLRNHGFRPAVDMFDNAVRPLDTNKWKDTYLNNPSILIIVAISPQYKADVDGFVVDSHGLHTKYIHSMMQNEFIQQGSLNFRFIPVLFLGASQKHVPNWLQNTCVYRWPRDTEGLLLRLLREERYVAPPVPDQLTLVIRPVAPSSAAAP